MKAVCVLVPETRFCPPTNGGHLRIFYLLRELARHFEVHAIVCQSALDIAAAPPPYKLPDSIRFQSAVDAPAPRDAFDLLPRRLARALRFRYLRRSVSGPAAEVFLRTHHLVERLLRDHRIDAMVFEHLDGMSLARLVRRVSPQTVRILDASNVEHVVLQQALANDSMNEELRRLEHDVRQQESGLSGEVHAFLACSEHDRECLSTLNRGALAGYTVPNGVDTELKRFDSSADKQSSESLLFCGSLNFPPNVDALRWFTESIWPMIKEGREKIRLRIVGRGQLPVGLQATIRADPRIDLIGEVANVDPHYAACGVSVVPLRMGSGTRLKILEAMALGSPVVSTTLGAQGIDCESGVQICLADDPDAFAAAVHGLLEAKATFEQIRRSARELVETRYDWRVVGRQLATAIQAEIARKA